MLRRPYSEDEPGECLAHELRPAGAPPVCHYPHPEICPDHEVQCEVCSQVILREDAVVSRERFRGRLVAVCLDHAECDEVVAARRRFDRLLLSTRGYLERGVC